jgi:predicted RNase H-like nuclease (RuvC/YqgF family)
VDGYVIFKSEYHPDAIVIYKTPRKKTDYEIDKFPEEYQEEVQKLQKELNLTKKQVNELHKTIKSFNMQIISLEKRLKILRNNAKELKDSANKKKFINNFFNTYEKFTECLTSDLASCDLETKDIIKKELNKLIHLKKDVIEKYLT